MGGRRFEKRATGGVNTGPNPLRGIMLMLCAVLLFAIMDATAKWLTARYPLPMLLWARYTVHCLLMVAIVLPLRGRGLWTCKRPWLVGLRGLLLFGITICMFASFRLLALTVSTATIFITPLLVGLLAGPLLREKVPRTQGVAIALSLAGMLLMVRPGGEVQPLGVLFALGAALCNTAYQMLTRLLAPTESSIAMVFWSAAIGALLGTLMLPWLGSDISPPPADIVRILALGALGGGGHFLLTLAFRHAPANTLAPFVYVQLIFAGLLDLVIFQHLPDTLTCAGIALIAAAGLTVVLRERRAAPVSPD